jgi:bifunctional non-homologous end joining protein LigD
LAIPPVNYCYARDAVDFFPNGTLHPVHSISKDRACITRRACINPDWLFELKWDGFQAICFLESGSARLVSRNKKSLTAKFPALQSIAKSIRATTAVMDGELVAVDETGTPRFNLLRANENARGHVVI